MYVSPLCRVKTKTSSIAQCRVPANEDLTPSAAVRVLPEEFSYDNIIDNLKFPGPDLQLQDLQVLDFFLHAFVHSRRVTHISLHRESDLRNIKFFRALTSSWRPFGPA